MTSLLRDVTMWLRDDVMTSLLRDLDGLVFKRLSHSLFTFEKTLGG